MPESVALSVSVTLCSWCLSHVSFMTATEHSKGYWAIQCQKQPNKVLTLYEKDNAECEFVIFDMS